MLLINQQHQFSQHTNNQVSKNSCVTLHEQRSTIHAIGQCYDDQDLTSGVCLAISLISVAQFFLTYSSVSEKINRLSLD